MSRAAPVIRNSLQSHPCPFDVGVDSRIRGALGDDDNFFLRDECYLNASCAASCSSSSMNRDDIQFLQQIGDRIRERRIARKLTQAELAEKCSLHRTFIGSVERGERNVAILSLRKIAKALRVTPAELLTDG